jgi:hypothetical protein
MNDDHASPSVIRHLVNIEQSKGVASADPDDPRVRGFAEFGLPSYSPLVTEDQLRSLEAWRDDLEIPANSAFLDGTLLLTVQALLGPSGPDVITPVSLWELTAFIDALVCFDRLYCIANPAIEVSHLNQQLGTEVLTAIPDPDNGMLRILAKSAAADGLASMWWLQGAESDDAFGQEVQEVVDGWRAVLGSDLPSDGPFDITQLDIGLNRFVGRFARQSTPWGPPPYEESQHLANILAKCRAGTPFDIPSSPSGSGSLSARLIDGTVITQSPRSIKYLDVLVRATRPPKMRQGPKTPPPLGDRVSLAANATYRTYVNQGIANALALPYLPGTLRMPFRRLFVERADEVQDELVSASLADQIFAQQQPSSPLVLPFFTASVLQGATSREDVWAQMARVRNQSTAFRRVRADLDRLLERSQVSAEALQFQSAVRDEALKLADLAGAAQQGASVALGVVAQTGIMPLAGTLGVGVDAAKGLGRSGSWTRIWRCLFHRHEYFLTQTNSQAIALTNALPQIQQLWQIPKIGYHLKNFANATQQIGHVLRNSPDPAKHGD